MAEPEVDHDPATLSWEDQAQQEQQHFLELLGAHLYDSYRRRMLSICNLLLTGFCKCFEDDGMCVNESELVAMKMKIGFALCGPPTAVPSEENCFTGYSKDKLECISKVFDQILGRQHSNKVLVSIIYISLEKNDESGNNVANFPVFRIPNPQNENEYCFVDTSGRFYGNWNDFLSNNKLYGSKMCYPKDGFYCGDLEGKVVLGFCLTPASTLSGKVKYYADTAASVGSVAAGVCTLIPPVAVPGVVVCGVMSFYSFIRSSMEIADRSSHGQSLRDREACRQWMSLAGTTLGLGSAGGMAALKMMTQQGRVIPQLFSGLVTGLTVSSVATNGINIAENAYTMYEQDELASLQSLQLVVSMLFFAHSTINFKTARSVIVETQTQVLNEHGAGLSRRQRNLFAGMQKETLKAESDPIIGRAKIIRDLNHISNKGEFFGQILRSNKEARKNAQPVQKFKFGDLGGTQDGPINHGQTSSPQNVYLRQTAAFTVPLEIPPLVSSEYVRPHEPALVTQIRLGLQNFSCFDINGLFQLLNDICGRFKYGKFCMSALRIVFDMYNWRNANDLKNILFDVMELWNDLVDSFRSQSRPSSETDNASILQDSENGVSNVEDIMNELVEDVDFIPDHFYKLGNVEIEEEVYHFPVDHQKWGDRGELAPEDYVLIAQNCFGSNTECCNIVCKGSTANVYLEHYGLVTISSSVREQIIIVKKFKKLG